MALQPFNLVNSTVLSLSPLVISSLNHPAYLVPESLDQGLEGRTIFIPKTIPEVVGEKVLRPLIDLVVKLSHKGFKQLQEASSYLSLLPGVQAEENYGFGESLIDYQHMAAIYSKESTVSGADVSALLSQIGFSQDELRSYSDQPQDHDKVFRKVLQLEHVSHDVIQHPFWMKASTSEGYNLPHYLIEYGTEEQAKKWISSSYFNQALLDTTNHQGQTPLHTLAFKGYSKLYPYVDVNHYGSKDKQGFTPMHYAIRENNLDFLDFMHKSKLLTKEGCSYTGDWQASALHMAVAAGHPDILDFLIHKKIIILNDGSFSSHHIDLGTVLHLAIYNQQSQMLRHLLNAYFDEACSLLEVTHQGIAPLQLAAILNDTISIEILLDKGAFINTKGDIEKTPFFLAVEHLNKAAIEKLASWEKADLKTGDGRSTPIGYLEGLKSGPSFDHNEINRVINLVNRVTTQQAEGVKRPPNYITLLPKNIVWAGGGVCGSAYVPIIERAEQEGLFNQIKRFGGTSAGSITAALLATGYTAEEIKPLLSISFEHFLDIRKGGVEDSLYHSLQESSFQDSWIDWFLAGGKAVTVDFHKIIKQCWVSQDCGTLFHKIIDKFKERWTGADGLCYGEEIRKWVEKRIQAKTGIEHCTFQELYELSQKKPSQFKELFVFAVKASEKREVVQFSYADPKKHQNDPLKYPKPLWNDLIISDAIRASSSIPLVFKPHTLHFKDAQGRRYFRSNHDIFIDGGVVKNYPLEAFDESIYQTNKEEWGVTTNKETLGILLSYPEIKIDVTQEKPKNGYELLNSIGKLYYHVENLLQKTRSDFQGRSLIVNLPPGISSTDFNATDEQKKALFRSGKEAIDQWIQDQQKETTEKKTQKAILTPQTNKKENPHCYDIFTRELKKKPRWSYHSQAIDKTLLYHLPDNFKLFIGRENELQKITAGFQESRKIAITGLGGVGKSTLSIRYGHTWKEAYQFVCFIKAGTEESFIQGLLELARARNIKGEKQEDVLKDLKYDIERLSNSYLFIIDGLDDPALFQTLETYLPLTNKCKILITTRAQYEAKVRGFHEIPLNSFSCSEATHYLLTSINEASKQNEQEAAKYLSQQLGYFPLALTQVVRYISEQPGMTLYDYKQVFQRKGVELLKGNLITLSPDEQSVLVTWNISIEKINKSQSGLLASHLMKVIAFLGQERIPFSFIETWIKEVYPKENELSLGNALSLLSKYGFIDGDVCKEDCEEEEKFYQMHALVKKITTYHLSKEEQESLTREIWKALDKEITLLRQPYLREEKPSDYSKQIIYRAYLLNLYKNNNFKDSVTQKQEACVLNQLAWLYGQFLPNDEVFQYIDRGLEIEHLLGRESETMAALYQLKGKSLWTLIIEDELDKHSIFITQGDCEWMRKQYDAQHRMIDAILLKFRGKPEALECSIRALEIRVKLLGENSTDTAESYHLVAEVLKSMRREEEALDYAQKELNILKAVLGENVIDIAKSCHFMAEILKNMGRKEEALDYAQKELHVLKATLKNHSKQIAYSYDYIAEIFTELRNKKDALAYAEQGLEIRKKIQEEDDDFIGEGYLKILNVLHALGGNEETLEYTQQVLKHNRSSQREDSLLITRFHRENLELLQKLGRWEEALEEAQSTLENRKKNLGAKSLYTADSHNEVADIFRTLGNKKEALEHAKKGLEIRQDVQGEDDRLIGESYLTILNILKDLGSQEEALEYIENVLKSREKDPREDAAFIMKFHEIALQLFEELGDLKKALDHAQRRLSRLQKIFGESSKNTSNGYKIVGEILSKLGEKEKLLLHAQKVLKNRKEALGEYSEYTAWSYHYIAEICKKLGKNNKALEYAQKELEIRKKIEKQDTWGITDSLMTILHILRALGNKEKELAYITTALDDQKLNNGKDHVWVWNFRQRQFDLLDEFKRGEEVLIIKQEIFNQNRGGLKENDTSMIESYQDVLHYLKRIGRKDEALKFANDTLARRQSLPNQKPEFIAASYHDVASCLHGLGQNHKAFKYAKMGIKTVNHSHPIKMELYKTLVKILESLNQKKAALRYTQLEIKLMKELNNYYFSVDDSYQRLLRLTDEVEGKRAGLACAREILKIKRETLGEDSLYIADSYHAVVSYLQDLGETEEVLKHIQWRIGNQREALGEGSTYTTNSHRIFIDFLKNLGRDDEALKYAQSVLKNRQKTLGEDSPHTADSYHMVAIFLESTKKPTEALELVQLELKIREKNADQDLHSILEAYRTEWRILENLGRKKEVLESVKNNLFVKNIPPLSLSEILKTGARISEDLGDLEGALIYAKQVINIWKEEKIPSMHEISCNFMNKLLKKLNRQADPTESMLC